MGLPGQSDVKLFDPGNGEPVLAVTNDSLKRYWGTTVDQLCQLKDAWTCPPEEQERHRIYARLLMRIVWEYWNGYKNGREGTYPLNPIVDPGNACPRPEDPLHLTRDYYGHNIAAIAVDVSGRILDFDFNHNDTFNSSAEHAEARLVRRLYSLAQISEVWSIPDGGGKPSVTTQTIGNDSTVPGTHPANKSYASLKKVTIYTSLESCAQCSGIMALAGVKQVVYLQTDPGTYWIGRILRNLTSDSLRAPRPISGREIGFPLFRTLDEGYKKFALRTLDPKDPEKIAFWVPPTTAPIKKDPDYSIAITSFLCTVEARQIFYDGGAELETVPLEHYDYRPPDDPNPSGQGDPPPIRLTNREVLADARRFLVYAIGKGRRGTPHSI
jgi:tRNA(Arg) A34 adenosine deaminase TadA